MGQIRQRINERRTRGRQGTMLRLSELMLKEPHRRHDWYAEQLGVSRPVVTKLMPDVYQFWRAEKLKNIDQLVMDELNRLDWVEREAREAWEKSKQQAETIIKEMAGEGKGGSKEAGRRSRVKVITTKPNGDPRFIEAMLKCGEARRKILGLDAPVKIDATIEIQREREQTADAFIRILTSSIQLDDLAIEELVKKLDRWADTGELPPAPQLPPMIEASPLQKETDGQT